MTDQTYPRRISMDQAPPRNRFLSREECEALAKRVVGFARGEGTTQVGIESSWMGTIRWARNEVDTCEDVRNNDIWITRSIRGATKQVGINQVDDAHLAAAVHRAERLLIQDGEDLNAPMHVPYSEPYQAPQLWFDRTYQLDESARVAAMRAAAQPAEAAGMLSTGYIEVAAHGRAVMSTTGRMIYHPVTLAQFSVTVRDPAGTASGWAGVDWNDWGRVDVAALSAIALDKCLKSRNAVAVEPGRYTTVLEPQAVSDLVAPMFDNEVIMDRDSEEDGYEPPRLPFAGMTKGDTKIGQRVLDERITITADPMDQDLGFLPVSPNDGLDMPVFHPVTWFEKGVLRQLAYNRLWAIRELGLNAGLPNSKAFHMSGGATSIDEMIGSTKRGLLVTRFSTVQMVYVPSMMTTGYTRDGLWLIEDGKISRAVKNMRFAESSLVVLNNVVQLGQPQRVFRPEAPTVVPALKVNDFSFTGLADAV